MIKVGDNTIEQLPGTLKEEDFFPMCENFTLSFFHKKGQITPFSMFFIQGKVLLANWSFQDAASKQLAILQARHVCKTLLVTKYFFASETWVTSIKQDDPDLNSRLDKIKQSGVSNEPDRMEKLTISMENEGEKPIMVTYDIDRDSGQPILVNRMQLKDIIESRLTGMLDQKPSK